MLEMFVAMYFMFIICACGSALLENMLVLRLCLHAESKPLVKMPAWVSKKTKARFPLHELTARLNGPS